MKGGFARYKCVAIGQASSIEKRTATAASDCDSRNRSSQFADDVKAGQAKLLFNQRNKITERLILDCAETARSQRIGIIYDWYQRFGIAQSKSTGQRLVDSFFGRIESCVGTVN